MSTTDKTTTSTTTTTVFDFITDQFPECKPFIRYGFPRDGGGQKQEFRLRSIHDSVPDEAITASAVYLLTDDQIARLDRFGDHPHAIAGDGNIVKEIQTECERANCVLYPVYLESDARDNGVPFTTMTEWIQTALDDVLGLSPDDATFWYSGSRSIHAHVPKFVTQSTLTVLKEQLTQFCEDTNAELDTGVYKPKQQFRLPGVVHEKSGGAFQKVQIDPVWENDEIIRAAGRGVPHLETFADVLTETFTPTENPDEFLLTLATSEKDIETPIIEQEHCPDDPADVPEWAQYNAKEFSPYALASGNGQSVAVVKVKGTPFAREDITIGNSSRPVHALIPAYFYGARGCAGEEFTKDHEHAPLQLSKPDYEKWDYEVGNHVVIIGGKSNRSRIFRVDSWQATVAGHALTGEGASRQAALDYLESEGYDVGKAGTSRKTAPSKTAGTQSHGGAGSRSDGETEAAKLQRQAERDGIDTLGFREVSNVANRLLRIGGWPLAWEWLEQQYGEQFHPENTWTRLKGIVEYYGDLNVEVPPKPR